MSGRIRLWLLVFLALTLLILMTLVGPLAAAGR